MKRKLDQVKEQQQTFI